MSHITPRCIDETRGRCNEKKTLPSSMERKEKQGTLSLTCVNPSHQSRAAARASKERPEETVGEMSISCNAPLLHQRLSGPFCLPVFPTHFLSIGQRIQQANKLCS